MEHFELSDCGKRAETIMKSLRVLAQEFAPEWRGVAAQYKGLAGEQSGPRGEHAMEPVHVITCT